MSAAKPPDRAALAAALAKEEARLRRLDSDRADASARVEALRAELAMIGNAEAARATSPGAKLSVPSSPAEKVSLFRRLFRGREDVYPTRFVSKAGKAGYAPACSNKFAAGLCRLPKVKCGECTNQAFRPVDDAAVLEHLRGRHVMGVYPLLDDETC